MTTLATNHAGWSVEHYVHGRGWVAFVGPSPDKGVMEDACKGMKALIPDSEFRVYEALTTKEKQ